MALCYAGAGAVDVTRAVVKGVDIHMCAGGVPITGDPCPKCEVEAAAQVERSLLEGELVHWVDPENPRVFPCTGKRGSGARASDVGMVTCPGCIDILEFKG